VRDRWRRVFEVAGILVRHFVTYALGSLRLDHIPVGRHRLDAVPGERRRAVQLRLLLEDLGVAAIKIGQILSTRPDILAPAYEEELSKLQDAARPEPVSTIRTVIETELGHSADTVFSMFDTAPLAAASIGQAHAAVWPDGTDVVVKIRRPGVVKKVELDLDILDWVSSTLDRWSRAAHRQDLVGLTREFSDTLRAELDYQQEASNAERFAIAFTNDVTIRIPHVYRAATTCRVITLERLRGLKIDDLAALDAAHIDRVGLAQRAANAILRMVFEHGFFHADPHPGNFFVEPDGRIGLIDFGMVGTMDPVTRAALLGVLLALAGRDTTSLADAVTHLGMTNATLDEPQLLADLEHLIATHLEQPLGEIQFGELLDDILVVLRRHQLRLPRNLALLAKTFTMCEGVAAQLDPSFRMTAAIAPYVQKLAATPGGLDGTPG